MSGRSGTFSLKGMALIIDRDQMLLHWNENASQIKLALRALVRMLKKTICFYSRERLFLRKHHLILRMI